MLISENTCVTDVYWGDGKCCKGLVKEVFSYNIEPEIIPVASYGILKHLF